MVSGFTTESYAAFATCYCDCWGVPCSLGLTAPSEDDNPDFFLKAKKEFDSTEGDLVIICGDFNTTLDVKIDRFGYTTDNHRKC